MLGLSLDTHLLKHCLVVVVHTSVVAVNAHLTLSLAVEAVVVHLFILSLIVLRYHGAPTLSIAKHLLLSFCYIRTGVRGGPHPSDILSSDTPIATRFLLSTFLGGMPGPLPRQCPQKKKATKSKTLKVTFLPNQFPRENLSLVHHHLIVFNYLCFMLRWE